MNSQRPLLMNFAIPSNVTSSNNCTGFSFSSSLASPFLTPVPADICKLCRNFWRAFKLTKKNNNNKKNKIKKKIKNTFSSFTYTNYNKGEKKQIKKIMKKSIFNIIRSVISQRCSYFDRADYPSHIDKKLFKALDDSWSNFKLFLICFISTHQVIWNENYTVYQNILRALLRHTFKLIAWSSYKKSIDLP